MRDGIYKNLPLSPGWRAGLRSCMRDAERGTIAKERCERAVFQDLQRTIGAPFFKRVREKIELSDSVLSGIPVFTAEDAARDLEGQNFPNENELLSQLKRLEQAGMKGEDLLKQAVTNTAMEHIERCRRLIEQTVLAEEGDPEAKATMRAVHTALSTLNVPQIVKARLTGIDSELPPRKRPIDLDEDLTGLKP